MDEQKEIRRFICRLFNEAVRQHSYHSDLRIQPNLYEIIQRVAHRRPKYVTYSDFVGELTSLYREYLAVHKNNEVSDAIAEAAIFKLRGLGNDVTIIHTQQKAETAPQPPINAEFLLHLLLRDNEQEAFIGCLVERYGGKVKRFGKRRANIWFYFEVARSACPLVRRFAIEIIKIAALGEWFRRMIQ